ncbi:NPCBM/NEW2 domain-containing protein [Allokutzneria sp. A3M-2-11 16]|uniref:NPCBM/NEW2 domain-containing protein n=1 Tax=Allokutzneria sp. A3M-2-11 16 TaxID=2962043 RepID=UPI0020B87680|nr:NPCBM/NEW2 domain-containing protein [Allokutzneria sp. A3M-2-11 16]MCP3803164.1 NPCBM/NEW2 domain-containing protein [Allokutzneria sp. A3M-2-11 16]
MRALLMIAVVLVSTATAVGPVAAAPAPAPPGATRLATPPMGWNHWNHFRCRIDEKIVRETADAMVRTGLRDAGYRYVNVDDCWEAESRDAAGRLRAHPVTFPGGIKALADYVHERGLRFGIYTAAGDKTCEGRPGSGGHYARDAATFAEWGVDYVKLDWCGAKGDPHRLTSEFRAALDATGRSVTLAVSRHGAPWRWPDRPADLWRTSADIDDNWHSVLRNAQEQAGLSGAAGAGRGWNDPDMLQVGNGGMSAEEYRAHFSLWAITGAPLLMGNDIRSIDKATLDVLGNREVIAVDQDALGRPGDRLRGDGTREVWARGLAGGDVAVALFNRGPYTTEIRTSAAELGLPFAHRYAVRDLWLHGPSMTRGEIAASVPPHGVALLRVSAGAAGLEERVTLSGDASFVEPGKKTVVRVNLRGGTTFGVRAPEGWLVRKTGVARFEITAPANSVAGKESLTLSAKHRGRWITVAHTVVIAPPPPRGVLALSDHPRVEAENGWYLPMKVNRSFGPDDFCADCPGGPLSLAGKRFDKGLGTYASSQASYYLGGMCRSFAATVGVDDEVLGMTWPRPHNAVGTAAFSIYADGRRVYDSGIRTVGGPPGEVDLDVRGVRELRLVNHSAGDGNFADHADWAGMRVECAN